MTLASILIVDGDGASREQMVRELRDVGHEVSSTENGGAALAAMQGKRPDLMVCECQLPDLAGVELLSNVKRRKDLRDMRVLMTSAGNKTNDAVSAFESGADDFVGKPIHVPEFLARVSACLRRPATSQREEIVRAGEISIDTASHRVSVNGDFVSLAPREYRLMLFLLTNQDRVFSRRQLLVHVWNRDASVGPRTVDVHIRKLRGLLEPYSCDKYLQTVRGSGYRFSLHF